MRASCLRRNSGSSSAAVAGFWDIIEADDRIIFFCNPKIIRDPEADSFRFGLVVAAAVIVAFLLISCTPGLARYMMMNCRCKRLVEMLEMLEMLEIQEVVCPFYRRRLPSRRDL